MMTDTTKRTLTNAELETVLDVVADAGEVAGVIALWDLLLPDGWEHTQSIDPTAWAIPEAQWKTICAAMMANPQHDGMAGGTMMNSGPSSYEAAPEPDIKFTFSYFGHELGT